MNPSPAPRPYTSLYDADDAPRGSRGASAGRVPADAAGDVELLRRMSAGDDAALGALYDRWSRATYALVIHIVRDPTEAEDVLEEAFWQAWRSAPRYDAARGGVSTWLLTIARSRALDRVRARVRLREEALPAGDAAAPAAELAAAGPDPSENAEAAERRALVAAALATLPAEQRDAMELAYFGGLSQTEIAERTGQPLGTVKTRMRLAMQKLRDRLSALREGGP